MTHLAFIDWTAVTPEDEQLLPNRNNSHLCSNGLPVIFSSSMTPLEPWNTFLRKYAAGVSERTIREYGRDLNYFANYVEKNNLSIFNISDADLVSFRTSRLKTGLSSRSWQRETVIIRKFFEYLMSTNAIERLPWVRLGRYSVIHPRIDNYGLEVRFLNRSQWQYFLRVGLAGETEEGRTDFQRRLTSPQRDMLGATVALNTGMRLQEWSSLILAELRPFNEGYEVDLEASAKFSKFRTVYFPPSTRYAVENYIAMERQKVVRIAQNYLNRHLDMLAIVRDIDLPNQRIRYEYEGNEFNSLIRNIPVSHREKLVSINEKQIEPQALFLSRKGIAKSPRNWQRTFKSASEAVKGTATGKRLFGERTVKSHDLRHTFAIVILQSLQKAAFNRLRETGPTYSIDRHTIHNPVIQVQRLLGHSSPSTTMQYLRYIDESEILIQRALEEWQDPLKDYSEYLLEEGLL